MPEATLHPAVVKRRIYCRITKVDSKEYNYDGLCGVRPSTCNTKQSLGRFVGVLPQSTVAHQLHLCLTNTRTIVGLLGSGCAEGSWYLDEREGIFFWGEDTATVKK